MKNIFFLIVLALTLSSCHFHTPKFHGGESFKMENMSGQEVKMTVEGDVLNENWFGIKIKPSELDLYIEDVYIGILKLDKKVKMKRKKTTHIVAPVTVKLEQGAMFKAMKFIRKDKLKVQLKGKAKAGVFIFSKKLDVDEVKVIDGIKM